jgi:hypothetical protein
MATGWVRSRVAGIFRFNVTADGDQMKLHVSRIAFATLFLSAGLMWAPADAQQFTSDSWLSKPHGTVTIIPTYGQRNSMLMTTFSLFPKWEFTVSGYFYNNDNDPTTNDGYSNSLYAKYMFYENKAKTGGMAVKFGTGMFPGFLDVDSRVKDAFQTYWVNTPLTVPLFHDKLSWDITPGVSGTMNYGQEGEEKNTAWDFTYCTRLAWYPFNPRWSLVGEVYGAHGEAGSPPEYRAGLRWEPNQYAVFAITYGATFDGSTGAGLEFGVMLFSPPFACFGRCK